MKEQKAAVYRMTEGNPVSLIIMLSIPMLIGNLFQQVYNLVDSVVVGQVVGADALAAIGATNSVTFLFFALCNGASNYQLFLCHAGHDLCCQGRPEWFGRFHFCFV